MNYVENIEEDEPQEVPEGHNVAAIRMPTKYLDFIKRNPQLAQTIGKAVMARKEIKDSLDMLDKILADPELFEEELENGTPEELKGFLETLAKERDTTVLLKNLTREQYEEVHQKFVDASLSGVITTTDAEGGVNTEVLKTVTTDLT